MTDHLLDVPWGKDHLTIPIPERWDLLGMMVPSTVSTSQDPRLEAEKSLSASLGLPTLMELARPGMKIALVIDDESRPTPVDQLLPAVLSELERSGVRPEGDGCPCPGCPPCHERGVPRPPGRRVNFFQTALGVS
jgi:nickel-dependent lactate racemase